jgi:hypothetical protein
MAKQRNREEVINTQLAILISRLGVTADAETIHVHGQHRPDVLFQLRGLRVVIEGKVADVPSADQIVLGDARKRVQSGIAHIAAAVVYPLILRTTPTTQLLKVLETAQLKYRIITETDESSVSYEGTPAALMEALRRAQEGLTKDDIVEKTAKALSLRLQAVADLWIGQPGSCDRLSGILGITPPKGETPEVAHARRETTAKVSALVLANAYIFQDQLSATDGRISSLRKLETKPNLIDATAEHWRWIWEEINYVPIFQLGEKVLNELPGGPQSNSPVKALLTEAKAICSEQAALRHDLMGRIYHWLLHHAKFLGTYYTSVPAATLLLKLALAADWKKKDFGDPAELASFRVVDLACGTGTLLMAAAQAFADAYITARAASDRPIEKADLFTLHRTLMENMLFGYDVLPTAVHLTASTLALLAPEVAFVKMNLYVMPLGIDNGIPRLGSLDFLTTNKIQTQMALDHSHVETVRVGASVSTTTNAKVPKINLCVMNPPFVRSVGGNLLFGSLPDERGRMQTELKRRVKTIGASATAGLGSVFMALADRHLEVGGRMAFVLPAALASGEAWGPSRKLIADRYHLETVVASHDSERQNFSENTSLSEILFIARKLKPKEKAGETTYINLWRNPHTIYEAMDLAGRIAQHKSPVTVDGAGLTTIRGLSDKLGEMVSLPSPTGEGNWSGALFAQTELLRAFSLLQIGQLRLPGQKTATPVPLCRLDSLGALGPDRKRISEGFKVSTDDWTPYPSFWGHDSALVKTIEQVPNARLLAWLESPRGPDYGPHLWERAGRILLGEGLRFNTHRLIGMGFTEEVLSNVWWSMKPNGLSDDQLKAMLLWINSSLSILLLFGRRVVTQGAWVHMKQPAWQAMPVLDVRSLKAKQLKALAASYDKLSVEELLPLAQLNVDPIRSKIDDALTTALGLSSVGPIRELLAREPGLSAQEINPHLAQANLAVDDVDNL